MTLEKVNINFDNLNNITAPNITFPSTSQGFLDEIVTVANQVTGGFLGLIVLTGLFFYLNWLLADVSEFGYFRYSFVRAMGISASICGIMGLTALNIGFFSNFYHIVIFLVVALICFIVVWYEEN